MIRDRTYTKEWAQWQRPAWVIGRNHRQTITKITRWH